VSAARTAAESSPAVTLSENTTPLVAVPNEAPAKLIVDPPIPEQLALGRVFIQYRTENLRILPAFGAPPCRYRHALDTVVSIGVNERDGETLYNTQLLFDAD